MKHVLIRTSPKGEGEKFIGSCEICGQAGLTLKDFEFEECPNYADASPKDAVLLAIEPPEDSQDEPSAY